AALPRRSDDLARPCRPGRAGRQAQRDHVARRPAAARAGAGARERASAPHARRADGGDGAARAPPDHGAGSRYLRPRAADDRGHRARHGRRLRGRAAHLGPAPGRSDRGGHAPRSARRPRGAARVSRPPVEERALMRLLELIGIDAYYGDSHILYDVSLEVAEGEVVCLLGRNGAGKTTTLKSSIGLVPPRSGQIALRAQSVVAVPPFRIARFGTGYVPDGGGIFGILPIRENLEVARRTWGDGAGERWTADRVLDLFPHLKTLRDRPAGRLSGGEQQMLTIARTLMGNPSLLL